MPFAVPSEDLENVHGDYLKGRLDEGCGKRTSLLPLENVPSLFTG
jgi:hypothetical protein